MDTETKSPFWVNPKLVPIFKKKWDELKEKNYWTLEKWFYGIAKKYDMRPCQGAYEELYSQSLIT